MSVPTNLVEGLHVIAEGSEPDPEQVAAIRELLALLEAGAEILRPGDLFGPAQAAEFLAVNRTTIWRWKREGIMPTPFQDLGTAGLWTLWTRASLETFKAQRADLERLERQPAASAADA